MALIAIEGMHFFAYHGFYEEEQITGNNFQVDVYLETSTAHAAATDELAKTINYETVYLICEAVMKKKVRLLETLAETIGLNIKHQFKGLSSLKIRVTKFNPPLGGKVEKVWVETSGSFTQKCARCNKPMVCYKDGTCWCNSTPLYKKTTEHLRMNFGNKCLCKECLQFYLGKEVSEES